MHGNSQRLFLIGLFTLAVIILVNVAWWQYYQKTSDLLDQQLAQRLSAAASVAAAVYPDSLTDQYSLESIEAYQSAYHLLDRLRQSDSLAELFLLDDHFHYLISTATETDSVYFLKELHGSLIDSLFFGETERPLLSPLYQSGALYVRSAFAPVSDTDGVVLAVVGVEAPVDYFQDLTLLRNQLLVASAVSIAGSLLLGALFMYAQRRINRAEQQLVLSQTHAYLGRLVAVVAHELKNPLMILRGSAERIKRKSDLPEAGYLIEEVDRLGAIVSGYLDFARTGGSMLGGDQRQEFDLIALICEIKDQFVRRSGNETTQWLDCPMETSLRLTGYPRALRQVLLNLLLNGADACRARVDDPSVRLGISVGRNDGMVTIDVIDTGIGMSAAELARARTFEPFQSGKETGTGLGLYLTKKIVGEMGGSVELVSQQNKGTTVRLTVPAE